MDTRIIGWATATLMMTIVFIGVSFEAKAQLVCLVILVISLINYWVGTMMPPSEEDRAKGLTWYSWDTLTANFMPSFSPEESFFSIFGKGAPFSAFGVSFMTSFHFRCLFPGCHGKRILLWLDRVSQGLKFPF